MWVRASAAVLALLAASFPAGGADRWVEARVTPRDAADLRRLLALGFESKLAGDEDGAFPTAYSVFLPAPELAALAAVGLAATVVNEDLSGFYRSRLAGGRAAAGSAADAETPPGTPGVPGAIAGSMGGYLTFDEAIASLEQLASVYPGLVLAKVAIGTSHEKRPILAWKLSANAGVDEDEPEVVYLALMHAREPMGMMGLVYLASRLAAGYGTDADATYLLDHREVWLVPVLNPDGYVWNQTTDPGGGGLWRKNRRDNRDRTIGVDLNRNFAYAWGADNQGSSPAPASDVYRGAAAFSEPETAAVRAFVAARRPALVMNTHSYGNLLIRPWDWADLLCADDAVFEDVSRLATRRNGYATGNVKQVLGYLANGAHDDWMWGETGEKPRVFGLTHEAGNGDDGFWPAPGRIAPIAEELFSANTHLAWAAGAAPRFDGVAVDDTGSGDGDGAPEPGEVVRLVVSVGNHGLAATWGPLTAHLSSPSCDIVVEEGDGDRDLGEVAAQTTVTTAASPFVVRIAASASIGDVRRLELVLEDARGPYPPMAVPLLVGQSLVLLADDFEGGTGNWSLSGWGTEAAGGSRAGAALSDSPGTQYAAGADATATLRVPLDLAGAARAYLVFKQRFWIENDFDAGTVEASVDAGATWTALRGEASDAGSGAGAQAKGTAVYDGHVFDWEAERVDLSALAGPGKPPVRLRLRLRANGSVARNGWLVDDVRVLAFASGPPARLPLDPVPLGAVRAGADVRLAWPRSRADASHDAADAYVVWRAEGVRAAAGFAPLGAPTSRLVAVDAGMAAASASFAYHVVATTCAGASSTPPR